MDKLTQTAYKHYHPVRKPIAFVVKVGGATHYVPATPQLCQLYMRTHGLKQDCLKGVY